MRWLILLLLVVMLPACGQPPAPTLAPTLEPPPTATPDPAATPTLQRAPQTVAQRSEDQAFVRVVHAAASVPGVDVYIEQLALATNLPFGRYTESSNIAAGNYLVRVLPAGAAPDADPLHELNITPAGQQTLTLLLTDSEEITIIAEDAEPLDTGETRLRFVNAVAGASSLSLTRDAAGLVASVPFGQASDAIITASGTGEFAVVGDTNPLFEGRLNLRERANTLLVMLGTPEQASLVLFETAVPGRASLRVVNAGDAGSLSAFVDDTPLAEDIPFSTASDRLTLAAGVHQVSVYPASADRETTEPLATITLQASTGDDFALVFVGGETSGQLIAQREQLGPTAPGQFRMSFMNGLPDTPLIQAFLESSLVFEPLTTLAYGQPPATLDLDAGEWRFIWRDVVGGAAQDEVETATDLQLEPGFHYLYVVTGALDEEQPRVILSERVGVDSTLGNPEPTTAPPAVVRFVNAYAERDRAAFLAGGETLADLPYGEVSEAFSLPAGALTLDIQVPGISGVPTQVMADLAPAGDYTVVAFSADTGAPQLLVVNNAGVQFDGAAGRIRLINASPRDDTLYGLAATDAVQATDSPVVDVTDDPESRQSLPFGARRFVNDIRGGAVSEAVSIQPGDYDVFVVDMQAFGIADTIGVSVQASRVYDIIAAQAVNSRAVETIVVSYPLGSD